MIDMIGVIVTLACMYTYIFTDWAISREQQGALCAAVLLELLIEALIIGIRYQFKQLREE